MIKIQDNFCIERRIYAVYCSHDETNKRWHLYNCFPSVKACKLFLKDIDERKKKDPSWKLKFKGPYTYIFENR